MIRISVIAIPESNSRMKSFIKSSLVRIFSHHENIDIIRYFNETYNNDQ
jgi:hypothetical protein